MNNTELRNPHANVDLPLRSPSDLLVMAVAWRRFILWFVGISTVLAIAVSLLLPAWYQSTSTMLPPKGQGMLGLGGGLSALLRDVVPGGSGKLGVSAVSYSYLAILKSRRAGEALVTRFDLFRVYGIDDSSMENALKELASNLDVEATENGEIVINILDRDPHRAAEMTNYMVQVLNEISIELGINEARSNRQFLENRVEENKVTLRTAEDRFKTYQEKEGMVFLPEDAKALASSIGSLYARKVKLEVEMAVLRKSAGSSNPGYELMQLEEAELRKKLGTIPGTSLEAFRLYRDIVIQQKIMEFLVPLFEQARLEEHKEIPVVLVLDKAVAAEKKSRPKRLLIVTSAFLSSLIVSLLVVFARIRFHAMQKDPLGPYQRVAHVLGRTTTPPAT